GARAAARVQDDRRGGPGSGLPAQRPAPGATHDGTAPPATGREDGLAPGLATSPVPPGQIADPYGVRAGRGTTTAWHGAQPRGGMHGTGTDGRNHPAPRDARPDGVMGDGTATSGVPVPAGATDATPWDRAAGAASGRGPATALAAERARQARMAVVGPVTERWAPEQAGPVHENWQLAAPIGPATDLWALGALLFRAVQGHAPYPEENTAELVEMVCSEPPAFAEECGPLRPVVESLLRQDPTERLDFEELRGWLRSLVRSAPEPEAGTHVVAAPPVNASRLPIVRRRGELVRRRRAKVPATSVHARHRRAREEKPPQPRKLGRTLLLLILLALAAAVAYAMVFMPKAEPSSDGVGNGGRSDAAGQPSAGPEASSQSRPDQNSSSPDGGEKGEGRPSPSESSGSEQTQTGGPEVAQGFTLRKDAEGFQVAVATGWDRSPKNGRGQVVYSRGSFELIVVPGRDSTATYGSDPLKYQREGERELQPFRDSTWATSGGMRLVEVGGVTMAEGQFTWQDGQGRGVFVRNLAILLDGKYHVVQVRGPEAERDEVTRLYEQAADTYRVSD
ncbi:serine/threonine protein kinase, partial [Streptomyces neyagawaensis]|nr:serine/threonine protein kinase [Streptomyces neyagawaensis]